MSHASHSQMVQLNQTSCIAVTDPTTGEVSAYAARLPGQTEMREACTLRSRMSAKQADTEVSSHCLSTCLLTYTALSKCIGQADHLGYTSHPRGIMHCTPYGLWLRVATHTHRYIHACMADCSMHAMGLDLPAATIASYMAMIVLHATSLWAAVPHVDRCVE